MLSIRYPFLFMVSVVACISGCDRLSSPFLGGTRQSSKSTQGSTTDSSQISASSTESQTLSGSGTIAKSNVVFPPGSLAVDATIALAEGGDLSEDVLTDLGVTATIGGSASSVIVDSDGDADPVGTLAITLPAPANSGLALQSANLVVIYRVVIKATGEYRSGIIPQSAFSAADQANNTVTIASDYFGQFQVVYIDVAVEEKLEKKSQVAGFKDVRGDLQPSITQNENGTSTDTTSPIVKLTTSAPSLTSKTPVYFKAAFSEEVTDFTADDVSKSSGTVSGFKKISGGYEFYISSPSDGDLTVAIKNQAAKDAAGNWSAASNSVKITIDQTAPTMTFTTTQGTLIPPAGLAAFTVAGNCSEAGSAMKISAPGITLTTSCSVGKTFSKTLNLSSVTPGNVVIHVAIADKLGNESGADLTVRASEAITVEPEYAAAPNWQDHVRSANTTQNCDGSESGSYSGASPVCIDGGPLRKFAVVSESACTAVTAADDLGLFIWTCVDDGATISFHSRPKSGRRLADVLESSGAAFANNFVTVLKGSTEIGRSQPAQWWGNSFATLSSGASPVSLSQAGRIYTVTAAITLPLIEFAADNVALVVMPGGSVGMASSADNCAGTISDPTVDTVCLVYVQNHFFERIEGLFVNDGSRTADFGILVKESKFVTLVDVELQSFGNDGYGMGVTTYTSEDVIGTHIRIKDTDGFGMLSQDTFQLTLSDIYVANSTQSGFNVIGGEYGVLQRGVFTNNGGDGLKIETVSHWVVGEMLAASNSARGFNSYYNDDLVLQHATLALNTLGGMVINLTTNAIFNNVLSFNNTYGFEASGGANSGILALSLADILSTNSYNLASSDVSSATAGTLAFLQEDAGSSQCVLSGFTGSPTCTAVTGLAATFAAASGSGVANALNFLNTTYDWMQWGKSQSTSASDPNNIGRCTGSSTCQVFDWRVNATANDLAYAHGVFAASQACPTDGQDKFAVVGGGYALSAAEEVLFDLKGNDNGICEAGEICVFTPHLGAYQGEGNLGDPCVYSAAGGISGVTLVGYGTTHR